MTRDEQFMDAALELATRSLELNEMPVGAVAVLDDVIVGSGYWRLRADGLLDHSEVLALREAQCSAHVQTRRRDVTLYTTLEPCLLCMGAAMSCLTGRVVYALEAALDGAADVASVWQPKLGHPTSPPAVYHVPEVVGGVRREQSLGLMRTWVEQNPHVPWAATYVPAD